MSHTTNLATHIENAPQQLREHDTNTRARETGFLQRKRTGSTFTQRIAFGAASNPCPTDTDWTQATTVAETPLTPQGIDQRFTPDAAHFLYARLQRLVACVVTTCPPEAAPLRQRFAGVFIKNSTVITLPRALASVRQGLGDSRGASAVGLSHGFVGGSDAPACPSPRPHNAVYRRGLACGELGVGGLGGILSGGVASQAGVGASVATSGARRY